MTSGCAMRERKWKRGMLVESTKLFDGWYVRMEENDVFEWEWDLKAKIQNLTEWQNVSMRVAELVIPPKCCNEGEWSAFDVSVLKGLKRIEIGDECFEDVNEVKIIGLHTLERVVIGKNNFIKHKYGTGKDPARHFHLKDCEQLKELKIGYQSFKDYSVCEIANVPSLEVIEMGEVKEWSYNFWYASLELKSDCDGMK